MQTRVKALCAAVFAALVAFVPLFELFDRALVTYWKWQHEGRRMKFAFWADERSLLSALSVGGRDLYYPPEESDHPVEDFDWDVQGANRRDRRIAELFQNETRQFMVRKVEVGGAGSFTIIFDDEYALDVFPDDSLSDEHWRIFKPSAEDQHFVVTGKGLDS